ncbi:hypothetical protein [Pseudoduganella namucuonensis]|uniref:Uncharacterized protein n=1 Tax=Pseudoduganella namucuonensis TaxID=1035707 RepID=A0A1I7LUH7_9BURK|nr:hypothetical protein [Pseudoduganella namucuonensis]SFV13292.1 hypothetical protein SAMN05216552_103821 [Pseudoduganella namucuonensis]
MGFRVSAIGLACGALLTACGGGGGGDGGGAVQAITFNFPGGPAVAVPPEVATTKLVATASSGGPVTFTSNTPAVCTVSGSTLSLLKAGECSVTASQAGHDGYAPTSERQLFVIPKRPQSIVFRNPGAQPLDAKPVPLAATSSVGLPLAFESATPAVCSVSGTSLLKLADGICTVAVKQGGTDIFAEAKTVKNIPIGAAKAPALTFLSGYKDSSNTKEGGKVEGAAGAGMNGWWCNGWCETVVAADGGSISFAHTIKLNQPSDGKWIDGYWGAFTVYGAGVQELSKLGDTAGGVRIDAQAGVNFNLSQNAEWFSAGNPGINVELVMGHLVVKKKSDGSDDLCHVKLKSTVTPASAAPTNYSIALKDFTIGESCGLADLNMWNEIQDYAISAVAFGAVAYNQTVSSTGTAKPSYPTRLTLTGPITFQ